jgi:hypothetical protein
MGAPFSNYSGIATLENEGLELSGFISLDASSNVQGYLPTTSAYSLAGASNSQPYTRMKGLQKAIGQYGAVVTQPHTATGVYTFTLDDPWFGCLEAWVQLIDQGAVSTIAGFVDVNATGTTGSSSYGFFPGQNQSLAAQTVRVRFRAASGGALTDPAASTGFFMGLLLKRTAVI